MSLNNNDWMQIPSYHILSNNRAHLEQDPFG